MGTVSLYLSRDAARRRPTATIALVGAAALLAVGAASGGQTGASAVVRQPPPQPGPQLDVVAVGCAMGLTAVLLVLAAPALVVRAETAASRLGWALVVLGGLCSAEVVARVLTPGQPASMVGALTRLAGMAMCLALLLSAHRGWRSPWPPALEGAVALVVLLGVFVGLSGLHVSALGPFEAPPSAHVAIELLTASGWAALAVVLARGRRHRLGPVGAMLPSVVALAHLCLAAEAGHVTGLTLLAAAVSVVTAALVARSSWKALLEHVRADRAQRDLDRQDLAAARAAADVHAGRLADVAHDARNACAGVRAAVELLCRSDGRLDASTVATLRAVAMSGVGQLEEVVSVPGPETGEVDLALVTRDLVRTRRLLGHDVELGGATSAVATARAGDAARILLNLLVNAEQHGGGAPTRVEVEHGATLVRIVVHDLGPGVPAAHVHRVFDRTERGTESDGQGLGLSIARSLARTQGGDLRLAASARGARFELTLPLAPVQAPTTRPHVEVPAAQAVPVHAG